MGDSNSPNRQARRSRRRRAEEAADEMWRKVRQGIAGLLAPVDKSGQHARRWVVSHRRWTYPVLAVLGIAVAAMLPLLGDWVALPDWLRRATSGSALARFALFALFALGLNVVVGFAGLLDLGYVAFWAIGAYTAGLLSGAATFSRAIRTPSSEVIARPEWEAWMWLILVVALLVAVLAGILLGSPTLRLRGDYLAIVTLGFGEIIRTSAKNLESVTLGPQGISSIPHPAISIGSFKLVWGTVLDNKYYWLLLSFVVVWIIAITLLDRSRIGRAWVAIREDEVAAAAMGVPVVRMKLTAFVIGACTAGVGGVVFAQQINTISPGTFGIIQSVLILCMVVIGGMGSIPGALVGAALIVLVPEIFRGFDEYRFFAFGVALIVVMIWRPQGLVPSKRRKAELKGSVREEQLYDVSTQGSGGA
jgi:branched-chain amino acid transport system permease protein